MNEDQKIPDGERTDKITGIHKLPLLGALAVVALTVFVVIGAQTSKTGKVGRTIGEPIAERELIFRDAKNGHIVVRDAQTKALLGKYGRGEGAFIRQSMRAMTHSRRQHRVAQGQPYRLVRAKGGKLSIVDPVTGTFIKLNAFGAVAMNSFSKFLPETPAKAQSQKTSQKANQQKQKGV